MPKVYDYIIVGAGIAGCSTAFFLSKYNQNILIIDKEKIASGGSGAAGAFLSPLLGKDNLFKDLVNNALKFSINFYSKNFKNNFDNCGVLRIPQDEIDRDKFKNYKNFMDFKFEEKNINNDNGYFFDIGSIVNSKNICKDLIQNIKQKLNYEVKNIEYKNKTWIINSDIYTKNIILTTGAEDILNEEYIQIRPVWGQRIDIQSDYDLKYNIHKSHSISKNINNSISLGATHHIGIKNQNIQMEDTQKLIEKTKQIIPIDNNIKVTNIYTGCRACSVDYFPIVGEVIDSKKAIEKYPSLKKGTKIPLKNIPKYQNLYIINGVGGRGFVLSPYIANNLVEFIINDKDYEEKTKPDRLFTKWIRKQ
jgi:tRNA U-34 5-methylaminomethyl-2-thiouridine biosynthesis protein MnmC